MNYPANIIEISAPVIPVPSPKLNVKGYPVNWPEIATAVKEWAGWHCEHCGHSHDPAAGYILTVHHLDGIKTNCEWGNLVALCQRCHLHIQAVYVPGQLFLPLHDPPTWIMVREIVVIKGKSK